MASFPKQICSLARRPVQKKILLTKSSNWGRVAKEITELSEENLKECKLLGKGFGIDIYHCLYLANKHCKDFMDRVAGFRVIKDDEQAKIFSETTGKEYISVEFYETIK